jgi:hypothetical protein
MKDSSVIPAEEMTSAPRPRNSAWALGLAGLALLIVGYALSTWSPPNTVPTDPRHDDLRAMARDDPELRRRLDDYRPRPQRSPFEFPGRIVFFIGVALFIGAAVKMWQAPLPTEDGRTPEVS